MHSDALYILSSLLDWDPVSDIIIFSQWLHETLVYIEIIISDDNFRSLWFLELFHASLISWIFQRFHLRFLWHQLKDNHALVMNHFWIIFMHIWNNFSHIGCSWRCRCSCCSKFIRDSLFIFWYSHILTNERTIFIKTTWNKNNNWFTFGNIYTLN